MDVKNAMKEFETYLYVKTLAGVKRHQGLAVFLCGLALLHFGLAEASIAQTGGEIFDQSACTLNEEVLTKDFGAMLSAIAGLLAIMSSVVGAFKAAWALVFVTVGTFVAPHVIAELFQLSCGGGGGG